MFVFPEGMAPMDGKPRLRSTRWERLLKTIENDTYEEKLHEYEPNYEDPELKEAVMKEMQYLDALVVFYEKQEPEEVPVPKHL